MGTLTGQDITDRAWALNNDTGVRWVSALCLAAINDGQREVVMYLPSAFTKSATPTLIAGTRQTLSGLSIADGVQVLDVPRNYVGANPGQAITQRTRAWIDETRPGWHNETASATVRHFFTDERDPKSFYVWPPSNGGKIELVYAAVPPELGALATVISLDDVYANALMYYLMFRMATVNKTGQQSPAAAQNWYALFLQALGVKDQRVRSNDMKGQP